MLAGGRASGTAGSSGRKRLHRRPGYMRGEQSRLHGPTYGPEEEEEEEAERSTCIRNGKSGRHTDVTDETGSHRSLAPAVQVPSINQQQSEYLTSTSWKSSSFFHSVAPPLHPVDCSLINGTHSYQAQSSAPQSELRLSPSPSLQSSVRDAFNSSFSFIQQSLDSSQKTDTTTAAPAREPQITPAPLLSDVSKRSPPIQPSSATGSQAERQNLSLGGRFWRDCLWSGGEATSDLPDCDSRSVDIEITSSLSVDSDTASASSVTSGYESATPASDQGWDNLVKKHEGVLQGCLHNNRNHTKVGHQTGP